MKSDGQSYVNNYHQRRECNVCAREFYGIYLTCVQCWRAENGRTADQYGSLDGKDIRKPADEGRVRVEDGSRKRQCTTVRDDQDGHDGDYYGQGDDGVIQVSDDDEAMDDGPGASSGEEEEDEEEDDVSDEDWQGIAKFLGDDLIQKLRNKNRSTI